MELPPDGPQPPQYVAYPRGPVWYGSSEKLKALSDGYFGLNFVFLLNVLVVTLMSILVPIIGKSYLGLCFALAALVIGFLAYPKNKRIAFGCDWSPFAAPVASLLMGLNAALCCGMFGYVVMQRLALVEIKKYRIKGGTLGITKKQVEQVVAQIRQREANPPAAPDNFDHS